MIDVHTVDLTGLGVILPDSQMAVVMAQPFLHLTGQEPFVTPPALVERQLSVLRRTLEVARGGPHHLDRTHLTVLPEYSIPGLAGVNVLLDTTRQPDWPNATVIIGGIDGLTKAQYGALCGMPEARYASANAPDQVEETEWVNCTVTVIKGSTGEIQFWIQPKLWPAWEEQQIHYERMFRGRAINLFKGQLTNGLYFRLVSIICFDWIATVEAKAPIDWVVANLDENAGEAQLPLTWVLVVQNNPKPSHRTFLAKIGPFFDQLRFPRVLRDNSALLFCNSAGRDKPHKADAFGATSVLHSGRAHFRPPHNMPTISKGGARFRDGSDALADLNDCFFRERGACIHAFTLNSSSLLPAGAAGRSFAVDDARVFSFDEPCARAPNGPVAASVKWLHDALDDSAPIGHDFNDAALTNLANDAHLAVLHHLQALNGKSISKLIELASGASSKDGADDWAAPQEDAVRHVTTTLDILVASTPNCEISASDSHAFLNVDDVEFDVLAIHGSKHEDCLERAKWQVGAVQRNLLLVSRDRHNTSFDRRIGSYLDDAHTGEKRFTFPSDSLRVVGFQDLLRAFRDAQDRDGLALAIKEIFQ